MVGTPAFVAPEVYADASGYDVKADIWSLGMTVSNCFSVKIRMSLIKQNQTAKSDKMTEPGLVHLDLGEPPPCLDLSASSQLGEPLVAFLKKCLERDPDERASAKELLRDPFIDNSEVLEKLSKADVDYIETLKKQTIPKKEEQTTPQKTATSPVSEKQKIAPKKSAKKKKKKSNTVCVSKIDWRRGRSNKTSKKMEQGGSMEKHQPK